MHKLGQLVGVAAILWLTGCSQPPPPAPAEKNQEKLPAVATVVRGGIEFVKGYMAGYDFAKKADRPMLVFFTAQWCNYCHQMEQDAFVDASVTTLAKRFVCILVDADQEPEVCQELDVRGYPTIQFMTSRGVPLNRLTGRRPADQLVSQMAAALEAAAARAERIGEPIVR